MSLQTDKLEIVRLLLDTNNREILNKVKSLLKHESSKETDYLLSEKANADHLEKGMKQADQGNYKAMDIDNLWK